MGKRTTLSEKEVESLLNEVLSPDPARTTLEIYEFISLHRVKIESEIGRFLKYFEDFFDEINIVIQLLNFVPKENWKMHKAIQYLLYPEAMKTLHRAFEDLIDGYYDESLMLVRSVYETFLRIVFLSCYPTEWEAVFFDRKNKMNFNVTSFVKDHLKVNLDLVYRFTSKVHHSKIHKNLQSLVERSKPNTGNPIRLEYKGDRKSMEISVNFLTLVLACLFHSMISIFGEDFHGYLKLEDRIARLMRIDRILLSLVALHPKEKFASFSGGLEKIGEIIRAADSGKDWKQIADVKNPRNESK